MALEKNACKNKEKNMTKILDGRGNNKKQENEGKIEGRQHQNENEQLGKGKGKNKRQRNRTQKGLRTPYVEMHNPCMYES